MIDCKFPFNEHSRDPIQHTSILFCRQQGDSQTLPDGRAHNLFSHEAQNI